MGGRRQEARDVGLNMPKKMEYTAYREGHLLADWVELTLFCQFPDR